MYRQIYHCPYCNLCRLGKGLGIDFFHCMVCNACMDPSLTVHLCRAKCFEDFCPICHESIFTSSTSIKSLKCSHLMHSACFQVFIYHQVPSLPLSLYSYTDYLLTNFAKGLHVFPLHLPNLQQVARGHAGFYQTLLPFLFQFLGQI